MCSLLASRDRFTREFLEPARSRVGRYTRAELYRPYVQIFSSPLLRVFDRTLERKLPLVGQSSGPAFNGLRIRTLAATVMITFTSNILPDDLEPVALILVTLP